MEKERKNKEQSILLSPVVLKRLKGWKDAAKISVSTTAAVAKKTESQ